MKLEIKHNGDRIVVPVKVIPGMQSSSFGGVRSGELLFKIAAAPDKGKANAELERYLAGLLGIAPSAVRIVVGDSSRHKKVSLPAKTLAAVEALAASEPTEEPEPEISP